MTNHIASEANFQHLDVLATDGRQVFLVHVLVFMRRDLVGAGSQRDLVPCLLVYLAARGHQGSVALAKLLFVSTAVVFASVVSKLRLSGHAQPGRAGSDKGKQREEEEEEEEERYLRERGCCGPTYCIMREIWKAVS